MLLSAQPKTKPFAVVDLVAFMFHEQEKVTEIVGILDGITQIRFQHGTEGRLAPFLTQPLRIADSLLFIAFQNDAQTMRFAQPV